MAKRWINSADVLVDDQGRIGVIFPTELLEDNQLRIDTAPIVGPEGYARTLADLYDRLDYGLFDYGYPFFQELRGDLDYYLYHSWEPWLATVDRSINDGFYYHLYDQNYEQPWMQTIHNDLEFYLYDWGNYRPWLETLRDELSAIRAVLEDVYDSSQSALRTV
jgi:hypothetical protein